TDTDTPPARPAPLPPTTPADEYLARWAALPVADHSAGGVTVYTCTAPGNTWAAGPTLEVARRRAVDHLVMLWRRHDGEEGTGDTLDEWVTSGMVGARAMSHVVGAEADIE